MRANVKRTIGIPDKRLVLVAATLIAICIPPLLSRTDVYSNSGRWFYESTLLASGLFPYSEFTWQYPPLGIFVTGLFLAIFGSSTYSLYAVIGLIALGIAICVYKICRMHGLESRTSLLWTSAFFGASNLGVSKMLGSLGVFTPTWPIGLLGLLITILGASNLVTGSRKSGRALIVSGVVIALLTKPEFAVTTLALFVMLTIFRLASNRSTDGSDLRHEALIYVVIGSIAATAIYVVIALISGPENVFQGLTGYGQSTTRTETLFTEFGSIYFPIIKELLRAIAGTTVIGAVLLLGLRKFRSDPSPRKWLVTFHMATVVVAVSLPGELLSRNLTVEPVALYLFGFAYLAVMIVGVRSLFKDRAMLGPNIRIILLLVASIVAYELLSSLEESHEILIMAPLRISLWIPLVATVGLAIHYLRNKRIERNIENHRLWLLFTLCTLAAGMQVRFVTGFGSAPEYSLAVLASLMLLHHFLIDNFSDRIGRFTLPRQYSHIPMALVIGVLAPTILFVGVGKPVLQYQQHRQTLVSTASGPLLVRSNHAPVVETVIRTVEATTPEGSKVISTSYAPWSSYVTKRPGLHPITQLQILTFNNDQIDASVAALEEDPPALVVEDLINDNETDIGEWSTNSRSENPWLWEYLDRNYVYCASYIQRPPDAGLWGVRFYVQRAPSESAPDCDTVKSVSGLIP